MSPFRLLFPMILATAATSAGADVQVRISIPAPLPAAEARLPQDFIGFGYETSAVAVPHYFDVSNQVLINLYLNLSHSGQVRIGGNISDHAQYVAEGVSAARPQTETTVINRADLTRLGAFLRASGWSAMWGLNLDTGTKAQAVDEAKAVTRALGSALDSFEIGNEVDLQPRFTAGYDDFASAWIDYRDALRSALPDIVFSGPDVANRTDWVRPFVSTAGGKLRFLTHHYYRSSAKRPNATLAYLLAPSDSLSSSLSLLRGISRASGIPYRINETNSFSGGGKPGVSDTLGAALWCLDYLNQLAVYGCAGVNIETGLNQFAWTSHYSPIVRDGDRVRPKAPYYGMLAFALTGDGRPQQLAITPSDLNATAYCSRSSTGHIWLTLINKEGTRDATFQWSAAHAKVWRLEGPRIEATQGIRLGGIEVRPDGTWRPPFAEDLAADASGELTVSVPRSSAALIRWDDPR